MYFTKSHRGYNGFLFGRNATVGPEFETTATRNSYSDPRVRRRNLPARFVKFSRLNAANPIIDIGEFRSENN